MESHNKNSPLVLAIPNAIAKWPQANSGFETAPFGFSIHRPPVALVEEVYVNLNTAREKGMKFFPDDTVCVVNLAHVSSNNTYEEREFELHSSLENRNWSNMKDPFHNTMAILLDLIDDNVWIHFFSGAREEWAMNEWGQITDSLQDNIIFGNEPSSLFEHHFYFMKAPDTALDFLAFATMNSIFRMNPYATADFLDRTHRVRRELRGLLVELKSWNETSGWEFEKRDLIALIQQTAIQLGESALEPPPSIISDAPQRAKSLADRLRTMREVSESAKIVLKNISDIIAQIIDLINRNWISRKVF